MGAESEGFVNSDPSFNPITKILKRQIGEVCYVINYLRSVPISQIVYYLGYVPVVYRHLKMTFGEKNKCKLFIAFSLLGWKNIMSVSNTLREK